MLRRDLSNTDAPRSSMIVPIKPTPEQDRYIRDGLAYMVLKAPFFAHLIYNEMHIVHTTWCPFAATDGKHIFVNADGMKQAGFTIQNVAFVLAHECAHYFLGDMVMNITRLETGEVFCPGGPLPYHHELMNIAEDFRINAMLDEVKLGSMPPVGCLDKTLSEKGMELATEIYEKLYKQAKANGGKSGQPKDGSGYGVDGNPGGKPGGGFDVHVVPDDKAKAKKEEASGRRDQAIAMAAAQAEASGQGTLPSFVKRILGDILEPKVSWQDYLRSTVIRKSGDPKYDWRLLDRRLLARPDPMYFAKQTHSGAGCIVIAGDTSGSIDNAMLRRFFAEMNGIVADVNPAELYVMWCDAHVHRVDQLDEPEDLLEYKEVLESDGGPGGGGGTSFIPVFDEIDKLGLVPDMVVYLTDTYGSFPDQEPDYPVIWASIVPRASARVPWGEFVEVEL